MGSLRNVQGQTCAAPRQRKRWTSSVKMLFIRILPSRSNTSTKSNKHEEGSGEIPEPIEPIKRVPTHSSSETVRNDKESTNEDLEELEVELVSHRDASSEVVVMDPWQFKSMVEETYLPKVKDVTKRKELEDQLQNTYKRLLEIEQEISKGEDFESSIQNRLSMIEEDSEEGVGR